MGMCVYAIVINVSQIQSSRWRLERHHLDFCGFAIVSISAFQPILPCRKDCIIGAPVPNIQHMQKDYTLAAAVLVV